MLLIMNRQSESIDKFEKEISPIDILINNAGMQFRTAFRRLPTRKV